MCQHMLGWLLCDRERQGQLFGRHLKRTGCRNAAVANARRVAGVEAAGVSVRQGVAATLPAGGCVASISPGVLDRTATVLNCTVCSLLGD
jgi:hypothetical protein